jgi:hypothetical protein
VSGGEHQRVKSAMKETQLMLKTRLGRVFALAAVGASLAVVGAYAASTPSYQPLGVADLDVTEGSIAPAGHKSTLHTVDPAMRAVALDGGHHATSAQLWFRYLGESTTTVPLGSGQIRRQIGLKLRAADPCNLLYVMWHAYPDNVIEISVKSNPGQTTSAQCGNAGYTEIAEIPLGVGDRTADHRVHRLETRTRRTAAGDLAVTVVKDGAVLRRLTIPAALSAGLEGPIGVRSDNGDYLFRLSSR